MTLSCPESPLRPSPPEGLLFQTCSLSPSTVASSRYHFWRRQSSPWKITHDRSQEIKVLCLFLFWQAIYFNPKSDFKSYNWLHLPHCFGRWNSSCTSSSLHSFQPHWGLNEYKWLFTSAHLQFCEGRCPGFLLTTTVTSTLCVLKHACFMKAK